MGAGGPAGAVAAGDDAARVQPARGPVLPGQGRPRRRRPALPPAAELVARREGADRHRPDPVPRPGGRGPGAAGPRRPAAGPVGAAGRGDGSRSATPARTWSCRPARSPPTAGTPSWSPTAAPRVRSPSRPPAPTSQTAGWTTTKRGEVWTMQEPFGAFTWYPVNDHPSDKAFYDVRISAPRGMVGIFNGRLDPAARSCTVAPSRGGTWPARPRRTSRRSPSATTSATATAARTGCRSPTGCPAATSARCRSCGAHPGLIRWLEARLGPYPFDRVGVVMVPWASAMETQTLLTMGRPLVRDRRRLPQRPGPRVRPPVVRRHGHPGQLAGPLAQRVVRDVHRAAPGRCPAAGRRGPTCAPSSPTSTATCAPRTGRRAPTTRDKFAEDCVYLCGALMLDRLSNRLGPELFAPGPARVAADPSRTRASTATDYVAWLSARTGQDLGPFLTEWLTSPTTPAS